MSAQSKADSRTRMVVAAAQLLAQNGYQATSFSAVLEASGAPRGSIYHHFPDGKDQLVTAAIELAGGHAQSLMSGWRGKSAAEVLDAFIDLWRAILAASDFRSGCSLVAVTVSSESSDHVAAASAIFDAWRDQLAQLLSDGGVDEWSAPTLATTIIAAAEGAVVLCRAHSSLQPLDAVQAQLGVLVDASLSS